MPANQGEQRREHRSHTHQEGNVPGLGICQGSVLGQEIKRASTLWIKEKRFIRHYFAWQEGFGAFSYGKSQLNNVVNYIQNQDIHHSKHSFRDEYISFLKLFDIEYDENFIFKQI